MLYSNLKWVDTYLPLILPAFLGGGAFNIFLLRQFFASIPKELAESAMIDGSSWPGIFARIYLPNAKPSLLVVTMFTFVGAWNDYFAPMIYQVNPKKFTLAIGLNTFKSQYGDVYKRQVHFYNFERINLKYGLTPYEIRCKAALGCVILQYPCLLYTSFARGSQPRVCGPTVP